MERARTAPLVGIAGCLGVVLALAYPYVAADGPVGPYYGSGAVNPLVAGLLAAVTIVVFAAGREGRTEPDFAAGVALVFGAFVALILLLWAASVRVDVVAVSPVHRWLTSGMSAVVPLAGVWYARALGVL